MSNILVADDDKACRDSIQKVLEREGHSGEAAGNVDGALAAIGGRRSTSLSATTRCRARPAWICWPSSKRRRESTVPVLMISAFADQETETEARELGALELLKKPFRRQELIDRATKAVRG